MHYGRQQIVFHLIFLLSLSVVLLLLFAALLYFSYKTTRIAQRCLRLIYFFRHFSSVHKQKHTHSHSYKIDMHKIDDFMAEKNERKYTHTAQQTGE